MMDGGWWMWGGSLIGIVFFVALIVAVVMLVQRGEDAASQRPRVEPRSRSADEILAERFARGEIDEAEFHDRRDALRS